MIAVAAPEKVDRKSRTILVVEDDAALRRLTQLQLERIGYTIKSAGDVPEGLEILRREKVDLVICDLHLPGVSGLELLKKGRAEHPDTKFVIVTAFASVNTALEAMKAGAWDYLTKPVPLVNLRILLDTAFAQDLAEEARVERSRTGQKLGFETMIGSSHALAVVVDLASRAARTDAPVLISGETGTGKEVLAKAIHLSSARREGPFVIVNCGAIPRDLVESELFGHVKGAFTGAVAHKQGKAEIANTGTLFLDEIGEMPLEMQVPLLRLIQHGEVQKVGVPSPTHADVRVIAATHRNLEQLVESGGFREDLYYRLLVVPIEIPPLRKRREDIADLVRHLFQESKEKYQREKLRLPESLIPYFEQYDWPGNVRQLANCIVRILVLAVNEEITVQDLPEFLRQPARTELPPPNFTATSPTITLDSMERQAILEALGKFGWNQTRTARHLGVTRKILRGRIAKYGIDKVKPPDE